LHAYNSIPLFARGGNTILFDSYDDTGYRRKRDMQELSQKSSAKNKVLLSKRHPCCGSIESNNYCCIAGVGLLCGFFEKHMCSYCHWAFPWRVIIPVHGRYCSTITKLPYRDIENVWDVWVCWAAWKCSIACGLEKQRRNHMYIENNLVECPMIYLLVRIELAARELHGSAWMPSRWWKSIELLSMMSHIPRMLWRLEKYTLIGTPLFWQSPQIELAAIWCSSFTILPTCP